MREKTTLRKANRALAAREVGLPPGQERVFAAHQQVNGRETEILRLPVIPTTFEIQNADGTFVFMLDFSALDGDDPLG